MCANRMVGLYANEKGIVSPAGALTTSASENTAAAAAATGSDGAAGGDLAMADEGAQKVDNGQVSSSQPWDSGAVRTSSSKTERAGKGCKNEQAKTNNAIAMDREEWKRRRRRRGDTEWQHGCQGMEEWR